MVTVIAISITIGGCVPQWEAFKSYELKKITKSISRKECQKRARKRDNKIILTVVS